MSDLPSLHDWALEPGQAIRVQEELRERLVLAWDGRPVHTIAGVDVALGEETARAAVVVLRLSDLVPLDGVMGQASLVFPYIPGLLSFREGPAILAAWKQLKSRPDMVMFDGQGIAHPRRMGIAAQMGLWLERPSIGVAKSRLYGRHAQPGPQRGDTADLVEPRTPNAVIGAVVRTRPNVNPLFVSPGHLIDLAHSVEFVLRCCTKYRLPEPTRWAHKFAGGERLPGPPGQQAALF